MNDFTDNSRLSANVPTDYDQPGELAYFARMLGREVAPIETTIRIPLRHRDLVNL